MAVGPTPVPEPYGEDVTIGELAATLWGRRWLLIACVIGFAVVSLAVSFLVTPQYRLTTTLVSAATERPVGVGDLASQLTGLSGLGGLASSNPQRIEETIAVLRSRSFLERFIERNGLRPILFRDRYDDETGGWIPGEPEPTLWEAYEYFTREVLSVSEIQSGELFQLSIIWRDPEIGAVWANALVAEVNELMRSRAIDEAERSLDFLSGELEQTNLVEVKQAIYGLIESQIKSRMIAKVRPEFVFRVVDPAKAPDPGAFFRPKRLLWAISGVLAGVLVGGALAFTLASGGRRRRG